MRHSPLLASLAGAALLLSIAQAGWAQAGQRLANLQPAASGSRTGAAAGGGLTVVPEDFAKLTLAPGFMLSLNVLDDLDFTGTFRIDQLGNITVPILGTMYVAGETVAQARLQIRNRLLDSRILNDPQVELTVVEYTAPAVTVLGEVASPGKYPVLAPRKLVDVLALAGGTTITAGNEVQIAHGNQSVEPVLVHYSKTTNPKAIEGVMVEPGDTVLVKRAGIVYVLGAVARPGGFVMQEEGTLNVLQAIALAFGTTPLASTSKIFILHRNADGSVVNTGVPYKKMTRGQGPEVQLHAADVLFVPTNTLRALYANTQQLVDAAATSAIYLGVGQ